MNPQLQRARKQSGSRLRRVRCTPRRARPTASRVGELIPSSPWRSAPIEIVCERGRAGARRWRGRGGRPGCVPRSPHAALPGFDRLRQALDPLNGAVGAVNVEDEARRVGAVAEQPQPAPEHEQGLVGGEEPGQDDDRAPVCRAESRVRAPPGRRAGARPSASSASPRAAGRTTRRGPASARSPERADPGDVTSDDERLHGLGAVVGVDASKSTMWRITWLESSRPMPRRGRARRDQPSARDACC